MNKTSFIYLYQRLVKDPLFLFSLTVSLISCGLGCLSLSLHHTIKALNEQLALRDIALANLQTQVAELLVKVASTESLKIANSQTIESTTLVQGGGYSYFLNGTTLALCLGIGLVAAFGCWYCGPAICAYFTQPKTMPDVGPPPASPTLPDVAVQPASPTLPDVAVQPASTTLPEVAVQPASLTLPEVAVQPASPTLPDVAVQPASLTLPDVAVQQASPTLPDVAVQPDIIMLPDVVTQSIMNLAEEIVKNNFASNYSVKFVPQSETFFIKTCDGTAWIDLFGFLDTHNSLLAANVRLANKMQQLSMADFQSVIMFLDHTKLSFPVILRYLDNRSRGTLNLNLSDAFSQVVSIDKNNNIFFGDVLCSTPFFKPEQLELIHWVAGQLTELI